MAGGQVRYEVVHIIEPDGTPVGSALMERRGDSDTWDEVARYRSADLAREAVNLLNALEEGK